MKCKITKKYSLLLTELYPFVKKNKDSFCNSDTAEGQKRERGQRGTFDGWFGESNSKNPREAMIWPGYFREIRP